MTPQEIIDTQFPQIEKLILQEGLSQLVVDTFRYNYEQVVRGSTGYIKGSDIDLVENLPQYSELDEFEDYGKQNIRKLAIIKLNGGLGTTMGLDAAKALLPVKNGLSFFDVVINQIFSLRKKYNCPIPLIYMNSFRTEADTLRVLDGFSDFHNGQDGISPTFIQSKVPKIRVDNFAPVKWEKDPSLEWCPPGHGDIFISLVQTGLLDKLISKGYEYIFMANGDNLTATFCPKILGYLLKNNIPWLSETTARTAADRKGGHLARFKDGRLMLRETTQCPPNELEDFSNIEKYKFFNTNLLWVNTKVLKATLAANNNVLKLTLIKNEKNVDPTDASSPKVYQLETAMGAAISCFDGAKAVCMPRTRFAPVKDTGDLLSLWSDNFYLDEAYNVCRNRQDTIVTSLDPAYYKNIEDFKKRFPHGAPSLVNCSKLTIKGDFVFEKNVVLKGNVFLENTSGKQQVINDGEVVTALSTSANSSRPL